ncbi:hypothetical protein MST27_02025 [Pseudomonas sp. PS1]|uniref:site-specific DNA-methyltransferase (adenine-specific) n=1 Tax=Stutzerimonas marianensis TaxID=2929513 RepID=A0A9X1W003_9GAMM|nr:DNA methyltransferase [Pseudomonas marianensis]MCJ0972147.1 hypothetical protein [Pseudomonas marianensis]
MNAVNELLITPRTDPVYNMHGYLTKVPVAAVMPFIKAYTQPGGLVVDMFAGSGMTAVAAKMCGRNAVVSDISRLGRHIGEGYLLDVPSDELARVAARIVAESREAVGHFYRTIRASDGAEVESIRTVWTFLYRCQACDAVVNYYALLRAAGWDSRETRCASCGHQFAKRGAEVLGEEPALVVVWGEQGKQTEQMVSEYDLHQLINADRADFRRLIPGARISPEREMYRRSALEKWGLTDTRAFFSQRNSAVLYDLWTRINSIGDESIRKKLLFVFTAILPRASKRYQWSHKAPLNAANQTYYIAPIFYEWNVYDLFTRKVGAAIKSDKFIATGVVGNAKQKYITQSASNLAHIASESVDYIFTDPPFGSNIFYADMNLFQECWLGGTFTNVDLEAVVKTGGTKADREEAKLGYERMLTEAFREARRILKPNGVLSVVFGNSKGEIWAVAQRAFWESGFTEKPESICVLDKGQRSIKGLASGRESVATLDLIVTFRKKTGAPATALVDTFEPERLIQKAVEAIDNLDGSTTSHVYLEVLRAAMHSGVNLASIDLADVLGHVARRGYLPDPRSGRLVRQLVPKV